MERTCARPKTPPALPLAVALALALSLGAALRCSPGSEAGKPPETKAPTPDGPRTAETGKPESPDAQAKPAAAPEKKPKWSPPRFTARQRERDEMVQVIKSYGLADEAVLKAMAAVPRHEFVPEQYLGRAYGDHPLPIGYGQTISQPFIVAEMTRQLGLKPGAKVLEIGTGSGYQAAVLTHFTTQVYTIEIVKPLEQAAEKRLKQLGYGVVEARQGDGFYGWPEKGPFDAIIVTCAVGQIPPPLLEQLKPGGRMVVPVGGPFSTQSLMLVEKDAGGKVHSRSLLAVAFVPLIREDPSRK